VIILDTNIIIDMINDSQNVNWKYVETDELFVCGIIKAELYQGLKNEKEENAVKLFLSYVDSLQVKEDDWEMIGRFILQLKKSGVSVPFQDAVISYLAKKHACPVLTRDRHFELIASVDCNVKVVNANGS